MYFDQIVSTTTSAAQAMRVHRAIQRSKLPRVTYNLTELQNTEDTLPMPILSAPTLQLRDTLTFNRSPYNRQIDIDSALQIGLLIALGLVQIVATYSIATWLMQ